MAAVTASPGSSPTSSPVRRKPVPLPDLSPVERGDWTEKVKPLPGIPIAESPRIREAPISPVRVNFQPENWAQPSNANIETDHSYVERPRQLNGLDRDLPKTPEAPTPPPHTPYETSQRGILDNVVNGEDHSAPAMSPQSRFEFSSPRSAPSDGVLSPEPDEQSTGGVLSNNRHSRESDATASTSQQQASTESSATTSASSVSGINEVLDGQDVSGTGSPESSVLDDNGAHIEPVPQLQYHHSAFLPRNASILAAEQNARTQSTPDLPEAAAHINRHLTPNSQHMRRSSLPRPHSSYSVYSDLGPRGRSPNLLGSHIRAPSAHSRRSPETRPSSYAELLNVPYPQPAPAPITFDNSQLRNAVGTNASLLSAQKTLEMYRQNVKKTNDFSILYSFAVFLIATAQEQGLTFNEPKRTKSPKPGKDLDNAQAEASPQELVREARAILQKLSNNGFPFAQYYLADGYASGLFSKGKEDYNSAFPLFVLAAKHGHAESAYRTALCYEFGWGCRKDPAKAVQFLRSAASKRHPGAMTRLGKACLSGDLGEKRYREGIKWLKLATEAADTIYNAAPYQLGCLYETGYGDDVFQDESYAAELFTQAADLGHPEANYRMGDAYEHGRLNCPRDPALSVHFYTGGAERGHAAAMMGLCAWYMVGAEPILEKDEEEAYEWARRSAELGYVKAQYAVGYFTEMGIGCRRDVLEANVWYVKAADAGDERAKQRLAAIHAAVSGGTPMEVAPPRNGKVRKSGAIDKEDKECVVM
ncbi:HCP-like protein [Thozetella sp. PMI_491]|nr:HCP-like protein [Thozetella sp. PMI_491]